MPKYFFKPSERVADTVSLTGETARHLLTVLRVRPQEAIVLCDGRGIDYYGTVTRVYRERQELAVTITGQRYCMTEPPVKVTLYPSIPKADKLEWVVQKCVEIGVYCVQPVITQRSVPRGFDGGRLARLRRIAESAACQSMRGIVPEINPPLSLADAIVSAPAGAVHLAAYENERLQTVQSALRDKSPGNVGLWIGPEGGFEADEAETLKHMGAILVTLGPRVLRAETAAVAALVRVLIALEE